MNNNNSFELIEAVKVQEEYCKNNDAPMFAPKNGYCYVCGKKIFGGEYGYTMKDASSRLITGCPYCHASFCD